MLLGTSVAPPLRCTLSASVFESVSAREEDIGGTPLRRVLDIQCVYPASIRERCSYERTSVCTAVPVLVRH